MMRSLVVLLAACVAACAAPTGTAIGDPAEIVGAPPAKQAPSPTAGARDLNDAPAGDAPVVAHAFTCRSDAFCEDFESANPAARWTSETADAALLEFVAPSASPGARSMRVTTSAAAASAYLRLDGGAHTTHWAGAFGFAIRLDALPSARLRGPRLVTDAGASVAVAITPAGIVLEQHDASHDESVGLAPAKAASWQRITIGVEANDAPSAPYGRIEVSIDGGDLAVYALDVPIHAGALELHAGVTKADLVASAIQLDDVMFFSP
jgi:hypothetical protein